MNRKNQYVENKPHGTANTLVALSAGVLYGLLIRLSFSLESTSNFLEIVSKTFLLAAPFCMGAIAVLVAAHGERVTIRDCLVLPVISMLLFLAALLVTLLEGLICMVVVASVFILAAIIGGVVAGWLYNLWHGRKTSLSVFFALPFVLSAIEVQTGVEPSEQSVSTVIMIDAPPEVVFDQLTTVKDISCDELGFSLFHWIGLPRPLEARMEGEGEGAVRTSRWEKNVAFQEVITTWQRPDRLHYRFNFAQASIPHDALDEHVEIGGKYFDILDGGYDLYSVNQGTELRLTTRFVNRSRLTLYGDLWAKIVLTDFHHSILVLIKHRAEQV